MTEQFSQAIGRYQNAIIEREAAIKNLQKALRRDKEASAALRNAKEDLKQLETELTESIMTPGLVPSSIQIKREGLTTT